MAKPRDEICPGEILLEEFMKPMDISARQLVADIDVSPSRISELVNGVRPITADTALRLGLFFQMDPRFWMNLQTEYGRKEVHHETPRISPAAACAVGAGIARFRPAADDTGQPGSARADLLR